MSKNTFVPLNLVGAYDYNENAEVRDGITCPGGRLCCGVRELSGLSYLGRTASGRVVTEKDYLLTAIHANWGGNPTDLEWRLSKGYSPSSSLGVLKCAYIFFTQAVAPGYVGTDRDPRYGHRFADWLEAQKLGHVHRHPPTINTNSGNQLTLFIWTVDHPALEAWTRENWY